MRLSDFNAHFRHYQTPSCVDQNDRHRVYMSSMDRHGWQCQFLEADLKIRR
jgi:hypothetical protein